MDDLKDKTIFVVLLLAGIFIAGYLIGLYTSYKDLHPKHHALTQQDLVDTHDFVSRYLNGIK